MLVGVLVGGGGGLGPWPLGHILGPIPKLCGPHLGHTVFLVLCRQICRCRSKERIGEGGASPGARA